MQAESAPLPIPELLRGDGNRNTTRDYTLGRQAFERLRWAVFFESVGAKDAALALPRSIFDNISSYSTPELSQGAFKTFHAWIDEQRLPWLADGLSTRA